MMSSLCLEQQKQHCYKQQKQSKNQFKYHLALMPLPTQIAGHGSEGDGQRAILKREDGKLLKPVQPPPKGPREAKFYLDINASKDPIDILIRQHIPKFFGIEQVGFTNGITVTEDFLVLEDVTEGLELPCIMDVKIGAKTWGPDATQKKITQESAKYTGTKIPFGFSITGMLVHSFQDPEKFKKFDKNFGKNLKTADVDQVSKLFLNHDENPPDELIRIFVEKISGIVQVFEMQRRYKIFASSLLLAYDAKAVRKFKNQEISEMELKKSVNIRLIDFAHVFDAQGQEDDNFLFGIRNLQDLFHRYYLGKNQ